MLSSKVTVENKKMDVNFSTSIFYFSGLIQLNVDLGSKMGVTLPKLLFSLILTQL